MKQNRKLKTLHTALERQSCALAHIRISSASANIRIRN